MFWLLENEELGSIKTLIVCPKRGDGDGDEAGERERFVLVWETNTSAEKPARIGLDWVQMFWAHF